MNPPPPPFKCTRRVGFLFPHLCTRTTPIGCPDCNNGQIDDPYLMRDRSYYSAYDDYGGYGTDYSTSPGAPMIESGETGSDMDFTEADGADMVGGGGAGDDFEDDMTGS